MVGTPLFARPLKRKFASASAEPSHAGRTWETQELLQASRVVTAVQQYNSTRTDAVVLWYPGALALWYCGAEEEAAEDAKTVAYRDKVV